MSYDKMYSINYSNIDVYESVIRNNAPIMRRKTDDWVNATQILKSAGYGKPQRTRILEREVHNSAHEKVQGGYGRVQGTWVPLAMGIHLAETYGLTKEEIAVLYYDPMRDGPVPKRDKPVVLEVTTPPPKPVKKKLPPLKKMDKKMAVTSTPQHMSQQQVQHKQQQIIQERLRQQAVYDQKQQQALFAQSKSFQPEYQYQQQPVFRPHNLSQTSQSTNESWSQDESSASQRRNSDTSLSSTNSQMAQMQKNMDMLRNQQFQQQFLEQQQQQLQQVQQPMAPPPVMENVQEYYTARLLHYFSVDNAPIPEFLFTPPPNFNINQPIDDEGHSPLHWAAAIANLEVVQLLIKNDADPLVINDSGMNALSKLISFNNAYELNNFDGLLSCLRHCLIIPDANGRTPLHYIMDIVGQESKEESLFYYMNCIFRFIHVTEQEAMTASGQPGPHKLLSIVLNHKDIYGDTALHIAVRHNSKRFIKLLLANGADVSIKNNKNEACKDSISYELLQEVHKEYMQQKRPQKKRRTSKTNSIDTSSMQESSFYNDTTSQENITVAVPPATTAVLESSPPERTKKQPEPQSVPQSQSQPQQQQPPATHDSMQSLRKEIPSMFDRLNQVIDQELDDKKSELKHSEEVYRNMMRDIEQLERKNRKMVQQIFRVDVEQAQKLLSEPEPEDEKPVNIGELKPATLPKHETGTEVLRWKLRHEAKRLDSELMSKGERLFSLWERTQSLQLAKLVHSHESTTLESTTPEGEQMALAVELSVLQSVRRRKIASILDMITRAASEGSQDKIYNYKRLISVACGLDIDDINEDLLSGLSEALVDMKQNELAV